MNLLYFHIVASIIPSYFIVSIFYRDLIWSTTGLDWKRYKGKRAVLISLAFLFILSLIVIPIIANRYDWFNYSTFAYSFIVGIPFAWLIHRVIKRFAENSKLVSSVPVHLPKQIVTTKRFLFFLVAGLPIGALFAYVVYIFFSQSIISVILGIVCTSVTTYLLSKATWR